MSGYGDHPSLASSLRAGKPFVSLMPDADLVGHGEASTVAMLGTIPSLRFASPSGLRELADKTVRQSTQAGDDIVRQGAASDDVFYIVNGLFEVLISHFGNTPDFIRVLRAGDSFGELGVLYAVPRTATVRCTAAGEVLRIPGEAFLDALDSGA